MREGANWNKYGNDSNNGDCNAMALVLVMAIVIVVTVVATVMVIQQLELAPVARKPVTKQGNHAQVHNIDAHLCIQLRHILLYKLHLPNCHAHTRQA